jgi:hypothetical protein
MKILHMLAFIFLTFHVTILYGIATLYNDHGLRKPFFIEIPHFWAWADKLVREILGHLDYFRRDYQHPFWYSEFLDCPYFPIFNHYFYKKLSLYIHIPNIYLGLEFEFGPQRIRDFSFVCP